MSYTKGAHYERKLIHFLKSHGYSTMRVAGSGHNTPADIVAMKNNLVVAIECKAHKKMPRLNKEKVIEMRDWCDNAGAHGFLAWRAPNKDWQFLEMEHLENRDYNQEKWMSVDSFMNHLIQTLPNIKSP